MACWFHLYIHCLWWGWYFSMFASIPVHKNLIICVIFFSVKECKFNILLILPLLYLIFVVLCSLITFLVISRAVEISHQVLLERPSSEWSDSVKASPIQLLVANFVDKLLWNIVPGLWISAGFRDGRVWHTQDWLTCNGSENKAFLRLEET